MIDGMTDEHAMRIMGHEHYFFVRCNTSLKGDFKEAIMLVCQSVFVFLWEYPEQTCFVTDELLKEQLTVCKLINKD